MAMSYNGWPASRYPSAIGINARWEPIPGHRFPGGIKSGDVQVVFTYLVRQLDARVEPIEDYPPGDEWGYNYRANVNDPTSLSCHASGTAIDYNATQHPNRILYTWTRDQVREIHKIINDELDGVIKWLEGWDEMHFEIRGNWYQVKTVADKIRNGTISGPNPTPTPTPPEPQETLVYKLAWIKSADGPGVLYRVLFAKTHDGDLVPVEAYDVPGDPNTVAGAATHKRWRDRLGAPADEPIPANPFIRIMDGPYENISD